MRILGIDTSSLVAGVALIEDDKLLGEYHIQYKKTHSQTLMPMLEEMAKMLELDMTTLDAVAVAAGPGSFTGLRIGSATAKGLGLALGIPLAEVSTLEGMAYNLWGYDGLICPMMDARRQQTYTGLYVFEEMGDSALRAGAIQEQAAGGAHSMCLRELIAPCAVPVGEMIDAVNARGEQVCFLGDGVPVFADYIRAHCAVPYTFAPAHLNRQRASSVALRGMELYREGHTVSAAEHKPEYLRLSQAERERLEAGKSLGKAKDE